MSSWCLTNVINYVIAQKYYFVPGMANYVGLVLAIILSSEFSSTEFEHVSTFIPMYSRTAGMVDIRRQEYVVIWLV
jgi:hypothetical protein